MNLEDGFSYDAFREGLKRGRSFVTTGPMLEVKANGEYPGFEWKRNDESPPVDVRFSGTAINARPLTSIEVLFNGRVIKTLSPRNARNPEGAFESKIDFRTRTEKSGWYVVRCWQIDDDGRFRFAHTAPWRIEIPGQPLRPRKEQIDYLIQRVKDQILRSDTVLPKAAIAEYEEALTFYEKLAKNAE